MSENGYQRGYLRQPALARDTIAFVSDDDLWSVTAAGGIARRLTAGLGEPSTPCFSADGKWLYFLSSRTFHSVVSSPWGPRQPEPFFDRQGKIYGLALAKGLRSPFQPADESIRVRPSSR